MQPDMLQPVVIGRVPWRARVLPVIGPCLVLVSVLLRHRSPQFVALLAASLLLNVVAAVAWPGTRLSKQGLWPVGKFARIRWQDVEFIALDGTVGRKGAVVLRRAGGRRAVHLAWTRPTDLKLIADYGNQLVARRIKAAGQVDHT
jgi:hypothetical protein